MPRPTTVAECGLPGAVSTIATEAVSRPIADGENPTVIVQVPFGATELLQLLATENAEGFWPVSEMPVMAIAALPTFERVRVCVVLLVPTS